MTTPDEDLSSQLQPDIPHAARMWNYWMGGKDNFAADRATGDAVAQIYPEIALMARFSRQFLIRAVRYLAAEAGIKQFLDIGTGLPTMQNTHQVAQSVHPDAKIAYVDNDPMVLVHARALLRDTTAAGATQYILSDYHDPGTILATARETLDFDQPIGVMFMGVMGYEPDIAVIKSIVDTVVGATTSGSHMVFWDGTNTSPEVVAGAERLAEMGGVPYILRSPAELATVFEGLELVDPGLVQITSWRPEPGEVEYIDAYGAVGRKP
jgi:hypothetical protein